MKWPGVALAGLLTLVLGLVSVLAIVGMVKIYAPRGGPVPDIKVDGTPEQIARGEHLATVLCVSCHGANGELPLGGGFDVGKDSPVPIGSFVSANLTPAGDIKDWSDGEVFRTVREGVDRNGYPLLVMYTTYFRNLSDDDLKAVIAFLRHQPAVGGATASDNPNLLGVIFNGAGLFPEVPAVTGPIAAPPKAATAEYGKYVLSYNDCRGCHGVNLTGGGGLTPPGPNLTFIVPKWTRDQFVAAMRTGVDPSGHQIQPPMPWKEIGKYDDVELAALYEYLHGLTPAQK